jgi:hypothetical protein
LQRPVKPKSPNTNDETVRQALKELKLLLFRAMDLARLPYAFLWYQLTGKMLPWGGIGLINAFCLTGGRSNDWLSWFISRQHPPRQITLFPQVLTPLGEGVLDEITNDLRETGFAILDQKVPEGVCDQLREFATREEAILLPTGMPGAAVQRAVYDAQHPRAVIYSFENESVLLNSVVQSFLIDPVILSIAQAYLNCEPIADMTELWWSTKFNDRPDGEAAQLYHFDMDRIKWLKFFIYLTDVDHDCGPHSFVAGSHRTGGIPRELRKRGYVRLEDDEVARYYPARDVVEFTAPRGTIIVEDTRGLHKGQHIRHGHRLMLQFQFSNSRFGPATERGRIHVQPASTLASVARQYPRIFSGYEIVT